MVICCCFDFHVLLHDSWEKLGLFDVKRRLFSDKVTLGGRRSFLLTLLFLIIPSGFLPINHAMFTTEDFFPLIFSCLMYVGEYFGHIIHKLKLHIWIIIRHYHEILISFIIHSGGYFQHSLRYCDINRCIIVRKSCVQSFEIVNFCLMCSGDSFGNFIHY